MPHKCTRCRRVHDDANEAVMNGCECGSKVFEFVRQERMDAAAITMIEEGRYAIRLDSLRSPPKGEAPKRKDVYEIDLASLLKQ